LATLVIVAFLSVATLLFLIRETGEQPIRVAAFLSTAVVSPLVLLGAALLYFDQAARHHGRHGSAVPRR
jgi:RsiW-degrading membrane proteinase PrsW (M82 family)